MIFVLQSSLCVGDIVSISFSMRSIKCALRISKNTSRGRGSPWATDLATRSACLLSLLGIFLMRNLKKRSPSFGLYQDIFLASGPLPCYFYQHDLLSLGS
jgi:hypothetical protein